MHDQRKKLKILCIQKDVNLSQIGRDLGVTKGHVSNVLAGRFPSMRVKEAVATALEITVDELESYIPKFRTIAA